MPAKKKKAAVRKNQAVKKKPIKKKAAKKKPVIGRPTAYRTEYNEQAYKLCLLGATDVEMADFFGVAESTIHKWKLDHPDFSEFLNRGKLIADATVAESLFKRANGYSHIDTKFASYEGVITDSKEYIKHYPPDSTAALFWLKNRQKGKWREKQDIDLNPGDKLLEFFDGITKTIGPPREREE